jgi:hypothetical protein
VSWGTRLQSSDYGCELADICGDVNDKAVESQIGRQEVEPEPSRVAAGPVELGAARGKIMAALVARGRPRGLQRRGVVSRASRRAVRSIVRKDTAQLSCVAKSTPDDTPHAVVRRERRHAERGGRSRAALDP